MWTHLFLPVFPLYERLLLTPPDKSPLPAACHVRRAFSWVELKSKWILDAYCWKAQVTLPVSRSLFPFHECTATLFRHLWILRALLSPSESPFLPGFKLSLSVLFFFCVSLNPSKWSVCQLPWEPCYDGLSLVWLRLSSSEPPSPLWTITHKSHSIWTCIYFPVREGISPHLSLLMQSDNDCSVFFERRADHSSPILKKFLKYLI